MPEGEVVVEDVVVLKSMVATVDRVIGRDVEGDVAGDVHEDEDMDVDGDMPMDMTNHRMTIKMRLT